MTRWQAFKKIALTNWKWWVIVVPLTIPFFLITICLGFLTCFVDFVNRIVVFVFDRHVRIIRSMSDYVYSDFR